MKVEYHLIIVIVNAGFSAEVMEIAKKEGVTGGTIVHARGSARPEAEAEFNIPISPEKDLIYIAVRDNIKDNVLKAIYEETGLGTQAQGIAFSLPITSQIGIK